MTSSAFWLRINGYPATEIAAHTPPTWETLADGGIGEVSWAFALTPRSQHQALRKGVLVEVMCGPMPVATAQMSEPDRTTWECKAYGLSSSLRRFLALSAGANTRDLVEAIDNAMAEGWQGTNPNPVAGYAAGDATGNPVKVGDLLDNYAEQTGQRWGADAQGRLFMRPDPTSATWLASPDSAAFGTTDEDATARLAGRYFNGTVNATAFAGSGEPQESVDLTERGTLSLSAAEAILGGMLTRRRGEGWTNGVTLHREQITTRGGTPAFLASVVAGQMIRAHGLAANVVTAATPWLDVTIGKTKYTAGEDVIYIEPVNASPVAGGLAGVIAAA